MTAPRSTQLLRQFEHLFAAGDTVRSCDGELLGRFIAAGDAAAFAALVHRHAPVVWGVCRRVLGHEQDAEDAFQATFLILARRAAAVRDRKSLAAYLYGIAYHLALKGRARGARRERAERCGRPATAPDPAAEVSAREWQRVFDEEMARLPEALRAPLILCCLEGLSRDEAAQRLGWTFGRVKDRLERGRELLRRRLARRGVLPAAALPAVLLTCATAAPELLAAGTARAAIQFAAGDTAVATGGAVALARASLRGAAIRRLVLAAALLLGPVSAGVGGLLAARPGAESAPPAVSDDWPQPAACLPAEPSADPLPKGAVARLGSDRLRHAGPVEALCFSADGKVLVSASWDKTARLWDAATGKELRRLSHEDTVREIAFSPDGKALATETVPKKGGPTLHLWDLTTGKEVWSAPVASVRLLAVGWSADGRTVLTAAYLDGTVRRWDAATGKEGDALALPGRLEAAAFSADGASLATATRYKEDDRFRVHVWDLGAPHKEPQLITEQARATIPFTHVAFSPDGKTLAAAEYTPPTRAVRVWDLGTCKEVRKLAAPADEPGRLRSREDIARVLIGPGGRVLVATRRQVAVWDATGKLLFRDAGAAAPAAFSPDGKALAVAGPSPSGGRASCFVRVLDPDTGAERVHAPNHEGHVLWAALAPGGRAVTADCMAVRVWDAVSGKLLHTLPLSPEGLGAYPAMTPDGKLLAASDKDWQLRIWDAEGKQLPDWVENRRSYCLALTPDGTVVIADGNRVQFHPAKGPGATLDLAVPAGCVVASPDGRSVVGVRSPDKGEPGELIMWDAKGNERWRKRGFGGPLFTAGGALLATVEGATAAWWDDDAARTRSAWTGKGEPPPVLRFREAESGAELLTVALPQVEVCGLAVSPDARLVALGDKGGAIRLWGVAEGEEVGRLEGHTAPVEALAFAPDGHTLLSGGSDGVALIWGVPAAVRSPARRLRALAPEDRERLWRALTAADGEKACAAITELAAARDDAVGLLKERLPDLKDAAARLRTLTADLDHDDFERRQAAARTLKELGAAARPALEAARKGKQSAEAREATEALLSELAGAEPDAGALRARRAVLVLEYVGSDAARAVLKSLAEAGPVYPAPDARAALDRLAARERHRP
jgi:RNA polymerase sigma factor (sigma-70 family)